MSRRVLRSMATVAVWTALVAAPAAAAERRAAAPGWWDGVMAAARVWLGIAPGKPVRELSVVTGEEGHDIDPNGVRAGGAVPTTPPPEEPSAQVQSGSAE